LSQNENWEPRPFSTIAPEKPSSLAFPHDYIRVFIFSKWISIIPSAAFENKEIKKPKREKRRNFLSTAEANLVESA